MSLYVPDLMSLYVPALLDEGRGTNNMYLDLHTVFLPLPENILASKLERCGCWLEHLVKKEMGGMISLKEL